MRRTGYWGLLLLVVGVVASAAQLAGAQARPTTTTAPSASSRAVVIELAGLIDDFNRQAIERRFTEARKLGADTVILRIDTYGGLVTAGLDISRFIKRQADLHTIAFVDEKAISAGAMIALACDQIVMSPASQLGDCAPIAMGPAGGVAEMGEAERAKAESPILEDFYDSAIRNGYDPTLVQSMVSVGRVVHWIENDAGERRFVDSATFERLKDEGWQPVPGEADPIDSAGTLLTVGVDRALKFGLASGTATSVHDLAEQRGLSILTTLAPGTGEQLVSTLSSTAVRAILTTVFMLALYWSFSHPGQGLPEAAALTTLGVLVGVPLLTGYAQWWEILAILLGLGLIAVEIFILPGFGVAGISGIVLVLGGLVLTWVGNEPAGLPGFLPSLQATRDAIQRGLIIVVIGLACSLFLWVWLQRYLPKLPYVNKLILTTTSGNIMVTDTSLAGAVAASIWPAVGAVGTAITDLRPAGTAEFQDDSINDVRVADVVSDSGFIRAGTRVTVRESSGNRVIVKSLV